MAPSASDEAHKVAVPTRAPRCLPAGEPGTSTLESWKTESLVNEQAA